MEEKELKTSLKQRIVICLIAFIMVGSMVASYAAIVLAGNNSGSASTASEISEEKVLAYEAAYAEKLAEFQAATASDYARFSKYRSEITAYNEDSANSGGIRTRDLSKGSGRMLLEGDTNYLAYYVGWCPDETVFDSSFDNDNNPTAFAGALNASGGLIEGWNAGVVGMNIGGIREITIPGELAYGDKMEICGGYNKPLKFIVMAVANEDPLKSLATELDLANLKVQYAYYGIDYDEQF